MDDLRIWFVFFFTGEKILVSDWRICTIILQFYRPLVNISASPRKKAHIDMYFFAQGYMVFFIGEILPAPRIFPPCTPMTQLL